MMSTVEVLSKYRQRIIDDAVRRFKGDNIFPDDNVVLAVCEGFVDLLLEPEESRDPHVVRMFMEWVYNIIRQKSQKTDLTLEFLGAFEDIVKKPLTNEEDADVDAFFELCREIVTDKHKQLARPR